MADTLPKGFRVGAVHCGLKRNRKREDLTLVLSDRPATAAGVYTQNRFCAAPVVLDRGRTPSNSIRAIVVNSGNANACTGERGLADAHRMTELVADLCQTAAEEVLVMSTGIIGEFLAMEKIETGIRDVVTHLGSDEDALVTAARGMMTTDTVHKLASRALSIDGAECHITGMSKGAAMIGPNMATMLGMVLTDAALEPAAAQRLLSRVVDDTFNCIHVDGHTSTNDTVLLLANAAAAAGPLAGGALDEFESALHSVCSDLARAIPADGEGATHLVTIEVRGCGTAAGARTIARTIADSPLVRTAIAGADPNWGRIVSAAGYANVPFDPGKARLLLNGHPLFDQGAPVAFDAATVSKSMKDNYETLIELELAEGTAKCRFWTTDLTAEYVRLNADYHT